ncbi:hypothetical protein R5H32_13100 [Defluviimonas sp. D31]|uniref:hypothetical protein n=1 Tax=Defluviimonas sp. D31 TaxID=3083253 RepID=UPI00296FB170|nr:hypothetical protein [Defluviimonas sp. D31]MDW4550294.1 hypothetical protein [Defluviimonas sp. D31]
MIGRFLDAFVPEKSAEGAWKRLELSGRYSSRLPDKKYIEGLAVSAEATAGAHLWRDRQLIDPEMYLSDDLHNAAKEAGLRLPKHFKMKPG